MPQALLLPLIDFERAADQHSLDVACDALAAGAFDWLVVSSATTVHVLSDKAAERGQALGDWLPATTRVATIGQASQGMLESAGVPVALAPGTAPVGCRAAWRLARRCRPGAPAAGRHRGTAPGRRADGVRGLRHCRHRLPDCRLSGRCGAQARRRTAGGRPGERHRFTRGCAAVVRAADRGRRPGRDRRRPAARRRGRITQRRTAHRRDPAAPLGSLPARRDRTFDGGRSRRARHSTWPPSRPSPPPTDSWPRCAKPWIPRPHPDHL